MPRLRPIIAAILLVAGGLTVAARAQRGAAASDMLVYFGTYTGEKSKGIYVSHMNPTTGQLTPPELAAETTSPSFLAVHPTRNLLYSVNEVNTLDGKPTGAV